MKKISIVSGGTGGLGLEIASLLARQGKNILILGRNNEKRKAAVSRLAGESTAAVVESLQCNVGKDEDVNSVIEFLQMKNYQVEYLFNNAGAGLFMAADRSTGELIDRVFEPNLRGMIILTSRILGIIPEEDELTIVNIMSTSALLGRAEETIYCAAKWGARGYTEALRTELKGKKRNIIAVYPGGMKTDFWNVPGQNRDTSTFMDATEVAEKIVNAVMVTDKLFVTDITINRKK